MRGALLLALLWIVTLAGCTADIEPRNAPTNGATAAPSGVVKEWDLHVWDTTYEALPGKPLVALAFSTSDTVPGTVPGPELRVTEGDTVRVRLHGRHTIHWHGVVLPWEMDGVPYLTQGLEDVYTYEFVAGEPGTYWYHCHVDGLVHVDLGMFGAFIVEPRDRTRDLPYDREETLILHETDAGSYAAVDFANSHDPRYLDPTTRDPPATHETAYRNLRTVYEGYAQDTGSGTGQYPPGAAGPRDYYPDTSTRYAPAYDYFMINGKSFPATEPVRTKLGETLRLRIINAGSLVHTMHLHGHKFLVTHKDGSALPAPYYADTIGLFPGERYDIYVKADNPGLWDFHDHGGSPGLGQHAANDLAFPGGMQTMLVYEGFQHNGHRAPSSGTSGDYSIWGARATRHAGH